MCVVVSMFMWICVDVGVCMCRVWMYVGGGGDLSAIRCKTFDNLFTHSLS